MKFHFCLPVLTQIHDESILYRCTSSTGERSTINITITGICRPGEFRCKDGSCVPQTFACDGKRQCADGSDESPSVCRGKFGNEVKQFKILATATRSIHDLLNFSAIKAPVTVSPDSIRVYEWTPFRFVCNSATGRLTAYFRATGELVEFDHRFHIAHINTTAIEVSAPFGLRNVDDMEIELVLTTVHIIPINNRLDMELVKMLKRKSVKDCKHLVVYFP